MTFRYFGMVLPEDTQASIDRYVKQGVPTGGFLQAVIENDLSSAVARADERHIQIIPAIVAYLYNECPAGCWGSRDSFDKWLEHRRIERESFAELRSHDAHLGGIEA